MLKHRLVTAALLVPPVVVGLVALPTSTVAMFLGLVVALGAWEWARIAGWSGFAARLSYVAGAVTCLVLVYGVLHDTDGGILGLLFVALVWWLIALGVLIINQSQGRQLRLSRPLSGLAGLLTLVPCWGALIALHGSPDEGPRLVVFLMFLVWAADVGAYFVGRKFGKHRLADRISPGKTWEGVAGALLTMGIIAVVGLLVLNEPARAQALLFLTLCVVTGLVSIIGDLVESLFKRAAGVKDSGRLLPGHGGVLDRIDSLTAAAPAFVLGASVLGVRL